MNEPEIIVKTITQTPSVTEQLLNYGALGIIVIILVAFIYWYIRRVDRIDAEIREHHQENLDKQGEAMAEMLERFDKERSDWRAVLDSHLTKASADRQDIVVALHKLEDTLKNR